MALSGLEIGKGNKKGRLVAALIGWKRNGAFALILLQQARFTSCRGPGGAYP